MTDKVILKGTGISKSFLGVKALDNVSIDVREGEVLGVIGENGAGKSTLMNVIFGNLQRDSGTIEFMGKEVNFKNPAEALKAGISMIHQETSLVQQFTASENIWLGMEEKFTRNGRLDNKARDNATWKLIDEFNLNIPYNGVVGNLSIAACQLIEVLRAVASNARLIIMDEPTSSLSDNEVAVLFNIIRRLTSEKVSIIYISHKIEEMQKICDRLSVYRDGHYIGTRNTSETTYSEIIKMIVGREINNLYPKGNAEIGDTVLEVKHLTRYGKFRDVSFTLRRGEILGFAGLQGAGRSEIAECIFGIAPYDEGEIILSGKKVEIHNPSDAVEKGIGMVTEDRLRSGIIAQLSVMFNMSMVKLKDYCSGPFNQINRKQEIQAVDNEIKVMQVKTPSRNQRIDTLSGGNQQKVILGRWIMINPQILILDEPTRGIDVGSKTEIHKLMGDFVSKGMSIILISSEMPEVIGMSDRIVVMREGREVFMGENKNVTQETLGKYALG